MTPETPPACWSRRPWRWWTRCELPELHWDSRAGHDTIEAHFGRTFFTRKWVFWPVTGKEVLSAAAAGEGVSGG